LIMIVIGLFQVDTVDLKSVPQKFEHHEIVCPTIGPVNVYIQVNNLEYV